MPLVSIIIPCYNAEKYLSEAIQSALDQTYPNCEVIVIDDGSTDGSLEVIKSFGDKIRWETGPNRGGCAARNAGLRLANGDYIQFLDADDVLAVDKITIQMTVLSAEQDDVLCFGPWLSFQNSVQETVTIPNPLYRDFPSPVDFLICSWHNGTFLTPACYLLPRTLVPETGWDESLLRNQDGEFFARVLHRAAGIRFTDNAISFYRRGVATSITASYSHAKIESVLNSYQTYIKVGLEMRDSPEMRVALANCFSELVIRHSSRFPDIAARAREEIRKLDARPHHPRNRAFTMLQRVLGYELAVRMYGYYHIARLKK